MSASDSYRLDGKVALVTGAGRGIGAAIAVALGQRGAKVVVNYAHSRDSAEKVVEEIQANGSDATALRADVADPDAVAQLMDRAVEHFGHLDIVSSNAGIVSFGHLSDVTPEVALSSQPLYLPVLSSRMLTGANTRNSTVSFGSTPAASSSSPAKPTATCERAGGSS
jgi:NAD(P)-dependent dehydrogenase (short-subunit alcohol dehydrogenase family)